MKKEGKVKRKKRVRTMMVRTKTASDLSQLKRTRLRRTLEMKTMI